MKESTPDRAFIFLPNASSERQKFFFQVQLDQVLYIPTLLIQVSSGAQTENLETEKTPTGREK